MKLSRRQFLRGSAVVGGGLLIGFQLTGCDATPYPDGDNEVFRPNAFVQIDRAGQIIFHLPKAEMGQGVYTGLTTILDRKSTRLNSSHVAISYAVVCWKQKRNF